MARPRKQKEESQIVEDFPIMHEPGAHDGLFDNVAPIEPASDSNVIPFTGSDQPIQQTERDTTQIDQFLAQYGIQFI